MQIVQVVKGESDALLYLRAANHKWDSCAGEAIILALGGSFSDSQGNDILYDPQAKSTVNELGNICVADATLYHSLISDLNAKL
jgi:3'-phosphoadenosine 5'-phosphosulfate (PAPS) 3'-phosphatase